MVQSAPSHCVADVMDRLSGSVPLVVDMSSGIRSGDQLVAALRDKCRRYYPTP